MENLNTIPDDIVSLRHHREQANKIESILVANINRNAKLLVELAGTLDLTKIPWKEAFADLYTGYVNAVGIMNVIDTAYEIHNDKTANTMRIVKTKGKILLDSNFSRGEYAVPFWFAQPYDLFLDVLDYIKTQAVAYDAQSPNLQEKMDELEELNETLQTIGDKLTSGDMDIADYMVESNPVVNKISALRNEINAIEKAQN